MRQHIPIVVFGRNDVKALPLASWFLESTNISSQPIVRRPFFARYSTKCLVTHGWMSSTPLSPFSLMNAWHLGHFAHARRGHSSPPMWITSLGNSSHT